MNTYTSEPTWKGVPVSQLSEAELTEMPPILQAIHQPRPKPTPGSAYHLRCTAFDTNVNAGEPVIRIRAEFILPYGLRGKSAESLAHALESIGLYFAGGKIDIVAAVDDKVRCFYCGQLNPGTANACEHCGGRL